MPALLKGLIDRVFLPGVAFKHHQGSSRWDRLLAGRSAEPLVTMDTPPWYCRWVQRGPGHLQMQKTILGFSGIRPCACTNARLRQLDAAACRCAGGAPTGESSSRRHEIKKQLKGPDWRHVSEMDISF